MTESNMVKFINPFTDVGFNRIFGQEMSKPILITLLNTLLEGEYHIVDLKYLDKELVGLADFDCMRLIYLQLPLFRKELEDCENVFEQMIYVLKNMDVLQRMPELLQNAVFQKIANIAEIAALSHEERVRYDSSIRHFRDTIAVMEGQFREGMERGMEKGMESANIANARKMKAKGFAIEVISDIGAD